MRRRIRHVDAETQRLAPRGRHMERACQSIEQRERAAEIAVMMLGIGRMVDLVMRGPQQPFSPARPERDPQMRMLEMGERDGEAQHQRIGAADLPVRHRPDQMHRHPADRADDDRRDRRKADRPARVDAQDGEQRQAVGAVMHPMQRPQSRYLVAQPMIEPIGEFIGQKDHDGEQRHRDDGGQRGERLRPCPARQCRIDRVGHGRGAQRQPAEQQAIAEQAEQRPDDIGAT